MNRRDLLRTVGVTTIAGTSGCLSTISGGAAGSISIHAVDEAPDGFDFDIEITNAAMRSDDLPPSLKVSLEYTGTEPYEYAPAGYARAAPISSQFSDESTPGLMLADYSIYPPFDPIDTWSDYKESDYLTSDCWSFTKGNTYFQLTVHDLNLRWEPGETITETFGVLGIESFLETPCPEGVFEFSQSFPDDYDLFWDYGNQPNEPPETDFEWGFTVRCEP